MKKALFFVLTLVAAMSVKAQNGTKFVSFRGGWVAKSAYSGTISLDLNTKYFNQNEIFAEFYQNYKHQERKTIMGGFAVKPVLFREGNTALRIRFGAGIGTTTSQFVAAPQIGLEYAQSIGGGFDFIIVNRNQYVFWGNTPDRWRIGFEAGIRIPIN